MTGAKLSEVIVDRLAVNEANAAALRKSLAEMVTYWPTVLEGPPAPLPLSPRARMVIANPPAVVNDPVAPDIRGELRDRRIQPVIDLYERLLAGDCEAQLDLPAARCPG